MKTKILTTFMLLFLFSCRLEPPVTEEDTESIYFVDLSTINVTCTESTYCSPDTETDYEFTIYYSLDSCSEFLVDTSPVAVGKKTVSCTSENCMASFTEYTERWDDTNTVHSLREDNYTLLSYIDIDGNGSIDDDEPYFCTEGVDINTLFKNTSFEIEITRLKVVTE